MSTRVLRELSRRRLRTTLTILGITIGIAAVLSMVTLGQFTKWKILDSYAELGVMTLAPVPEPAEWALMMAGLGCISFVVRRRRAR